MHSSQSRPMDVRRQLSGCRRSTASLFHRPPPATLAPAESLETRTYMPKADHADGAENLSERRSGGVARPAVGRGPPKRATLGTKLAAAVPGSRGSLLTERARQREQDAYALWRREAGRRTPACRCAQRGHGRASEMPGVVRGREPCREYDVGGRHIAVQW
ncbi:uncharacterized protein A4U43_C08F14770 [Asparagus officinalis]|nr:uncharacterized protein A4U43_C08F14770 [Asparagus officinalis]